MQIAFLSCKNPIHQCGISSYTFLLFEFLKKKNIRINWIPVNNKSSMLSLSKNIPQAEVYSLQFAPFSWASKGISGKKIFKLAKVLEKKKLHINFHEIWIGDYSKANVKEKLIGWLQKRELLKFIKIAKPFLVTSSNSAGLSRLRDAGVEAEYLYLFGNIPYSLSNISKPSTALSVAFFGTLYEKFPYDLLAKNLDKISRSLNKSVHIKIIGRQREGEGIRCIQMISQEYGFATYQSGELASMKISEEFQHCDLGISTTPYDILGKSGATAAMLEHGLPILAYDDGDTPMNKLFVMNEFIDQIFLLNEDSTPDRIISFLQKPRKQFFDGVAYTAKKMLEIIH